MSTDREWTLRRQSAYLIINAQIFPITKPLVKIGRKLENDLVIQDVLVSREHAEILFRENRYYLRDLKSTGGTFLNNTKIDEAQLFSNDLILIANTPIMFIIEDKQEIQDNLSRKTGSLENIEDHDIPN
jgi:pSer/pThr/pTyr-binding forkhead associated (FHA) protein